MIEFTASVYIIENDKALLVFHAKYGKWLPPGGHLEEGETPVDCARREALEETGLHIELIKEEHLWINQPHAISCERPFMCLIENIPAHQTTLAHQHLDFIFLARPNGGQLQDTGARWFTLDEIGELKPGEEIFPEVRETISYLLHLPLRANK